MYKGVGTLYFANPFRIKFKVTLNIGVTKVSEQDSHIVFSQNKNAASFMFA